MQSIIRLLHTVVYASKITIISFLGTTNHSILFLYILVIVCANLTSNAVIFKRISKGLQIYSSLLIDFCNDYRPCLCWQASCILFSIIISSFDFNLSKSLISRSKKKSPATMRPAYDPWSVKYLAVYIFIYSIVQEGWLAYYLWRNISSGRTARNTKEMWCEWQRN